MLRSSATSLVVIGGLFLLFGIFLVTPIAQILGYISLVIGGILLVIGIVRLFAGSGNAGY